MKIQKAVSVLAGVFCLSLPSRLCAAQSPSDAATVPEARTPAIYLDPDKPTAARIDDLISRMSLAEKVAQLMQAAPAIPRLEVPEYHYWSEALHGVARHGHATVFPQAIGMAAAFDDALLQRVGTAVGIEGRAKYLEASNHGDRGDNRGLNFWAPNINIFRDPRWGRGQETYGEDPFLTARNGVAYIRGLQGDDPKYLLSVACAKHFAVHSGPEPGRAGFNVEPAPRDLYETFVPQFQAAVQEAHVGAVMAAYNAINGVPCSANHWLLTDLLRDKWGFTGHIVSDCGAVTNIAGAHHYAASTAAGDAKAIQAGLDLECGRSFRSLPQAVAQGLVTEKQLDIALHYTLDSRFRLGLFDPPERVPFSHVPISEVESPAHLELARTMARESIVLLKNDGTLPLAKATLQPMRIAVIGVNAKDELYGNYNGESSQPVTVLAGIQQKAGRATTVEWRRGAPLAVNSAPAAGKKVPSYLQENPDDLTEAVDLARSSDVVIYVGGLNAELEGEESPLQLPGFSHGDRTAIELPEVQMKLLQALQATGKPVVFVNCSGSAIALPWEAAHLAAIVQAWYPGGEGGTGVADVLFGDYNPAGRLPITFYEQTADLPPFTDYRMANRTYRYFTGKPVYPFGYGLSFTTFQYQPPSFVEDSFNAEGTVRLRVPVTNTGTRDGDEVVQVYVHAINPRTPQAIRSLVAFKRQPIAKGATVDFAFEIPVQRFRYWSVEKNKYVVDPGEYDLEIGASSSDIRARVQVSVTGPS
jgi:beta-glucosidase